MHYQAKRQWYNSHVLRQSIAKGFKHERHALAYAIAAETPNLREGRKNLH